LVTITSNYPVKVVNSNGHRGRLDAEQPVIHGHCFPDGIGAQPQPRDSG